MPVSEEKLKICSKGHKFYKSSDCPTCPECEKESKPDKGFLSVISAPARRALQNNGITSLLKLSKFTEEQILDFHGIGPTAIPKLRRALKLEGLTFKK